MSAPMRWKSWVREAQLQDHLRQHLAEARWPLRCPHPLCALDLTDETSFLCHLQDIHSLKMTAEQKTLVAGALDSEGSKEKRKMQAVVEQESKKSKRRKLTPEIARRHEDPPCQPIGVALDHATSTVSKIILDSDVDEAHDLPELTRSQDTLQSDSDGLSLMNDLDAFFLSLRSPSGSPPPNISNGDHIDTINKDHSPTVMPSDMVLHIDYELLLANTFNGDWKDDPPTIAPRDTYLPVDITPTVDHDSVQQGAATTKPHITLQAQQPQSGPKPKPKLRLRLSQPKRPSMEGKPKQRPGRKSLRGESQPNGRAWRASQNSGQVGSPFVGKASQSSGVGGGQPKQRPGRKSLRGKNQPKQR